jgi:hypothetical protein
MRAKQAAGKLHVLNLVGSETLMGFAADAKKAAGGEQKK